MNTPDTVDEFQALCEGQQEHWLGSFSQAVEAAADELLNNGHWPADESSGSPWSRPHAHAAKPTSTSTKPPPAATATHQPGPPCADRSRCGP
jgi:hypothetical protein